MKVAQLYSPKFNSSAGLRQQRTGLPCPLVLINRLWPRGAVDSTVHRQSPNRRYLPPDTPPVGLVPELVCGLSPVPVLFSVGLLVERDEVEPMRDELEALTPTPVLPVFTELLTPVLVDAPVCACPVGLPRLVEVDPLAVVPVETAPWPPPAPCAKTATGAERISAAASKVVRFIRVSPF